MSSTRRTPKWLVAAMLLSLAACSSDKKAGDSKAPAGEKSTQKTVSSGRAPDGQHRLMSSTAPSDAPGPFQIFTYSNPKGHSRVCRGNTTTGDALCASGGTAWAQVDGPGEPKFESFTKGERTYLRYTSPFAERRPGMYRFFYYYNKDWKIRVCVGRTTHGDVICRDGTSDISTVDVTQKPTFEPRKVTTGWLHYFAPATPSKVGTYGFDAYRQRKGDTRVCRLNTHTGVSECAFTATFGAQVKTGEKPAWKPFKQRVRYLRY